MGFGSEASLTNRHLVQVLATVNRQVSTRDKRRGIASKKANHGSNFFGLAQAAHGDLGQNMLFECFLRNLSHHGRIDIAWRDCVNSNPTTSGFQSQGLGKTINTRLSCRVISLAKRTLATVNRLDVDNAPL